MLACHPKLLKGLIERQSEILAMEDLEIVVSLGTGGGQQAVYYTCDFSHE